MGKNQNSKQPYQTIQIVNIVANFSETRKVCEARRNHGILSTELKHCHPDPGNIKINKHHTHEKYFKCAYCGKAFTVKTELKNHGRVHTGKMPHNCKLCDKAFNTRKTLRMLSSNPS